MGADPVAAMTGERPIGVAIVDDHPVVVEGVRAWLATEPRLTVLATGDDPDEVLRVAPDADVVLLDLRLHGRMALDKLAELSTAGRRVVVYSSTPTRRPCSPRWTPGRWRSWPSTRGGSTAWRPC